MFTILSDNRLKNFWFNQALRYDINEKVTILPLISRTLYFLTEHVNLKL